MSFSRPYSTAASLLRAVAMTLALFWSAPGMSASSDFNKPLGELYDVALLMDAAVLDLNMLIGEEQSKVYSDRMMATLDRLDAAQKSSAGSLASSGISGHNTADLASHVAAFIRVARQNRSTAMQTGAPENAVVDEMMQHRKEARAILDQVYVDLEKRAGLTGSALSEARALALTLEQMAALYVENASAAYVSNRSQDSQDKTIDQMANDFSARLSQLLGKAQGKDSAKIVRSIQSKWKFIERSMLNYQENSVPFLVDRYTQVIVADLVTLAASLDK